MKPKLKNHTRTCRKCLDFFNTPYKTGRYCEKCKKIRKEEKVDRKVI